MKKRKIANPMLEFAEKVKELGLAADGMPTASNRLVKRFIRVAKRVPDERLSGMVEYPLREILLVTFFAVLSGADNFSAIAIYGREQSAWMKRFLKFKNGTPSHDTFRRVFSLVAPNVLQQLTVDFLMDNMKRIKDAVGIEANGVRLVNVDGKQANGTGRRRGKDGAFPNLQELNVYDASSGICLCMKGIDKKTNEIPAAQEALRILDIKGALVTCDALNTQKETMRVIAKEGKGDYVAALKKNHHLFFEEVNAYFDQARLSDIRESGVNFFTSIDKAHSQVERRNYYLTTDIKWFCERHEWQKLKAFVCHEKVIVDTASGEMKTERRLYISSVEDVELCAEAIRGHWAVENSLHWHLDHSFGDDADATTDKNAYENLALFRRMALTLCKMAQPFLKLSIRNIRWTIAMHPERHLGTILGTLDETHLEEALRAANQKKPKQ
jgi:predicted transposase YbfD/YdcC